jgi:hypothetical protein
MIDSNQTKSPASTSLSVKPEPTSAKLNWHYDTYYQEQLARFRLCKSGAMEHKTEKSAKTVIYKAEAPKRMAAQQETLARKRAEVIAKMHALAESEGLEITILDNNNANRRGQYFQ